MARGGPVNGVRPSRTRIKVCGITRPEDARMAAAMGVDALGFVFHAPSPRSVGPDDVARIVTGLPAFVTTVGLFVDAAAERIASVLETVRLDCLQFHGDESPEDCRRFGVPYVKAVRMRPGVNLAEAMARFHDARALLLDTYRPGRPGGTGEAFDWQRVPEGIETPIILAGGLDDDNVGRAIACVRPWAVDVSGGVESAPGRKDAARIAAFVGAVASADRDTISSDSERRPPA